MKLTNSYSNAFVIVMAIVGSILLVSFIGVLVCNYCCICKYNKTRHNCLLCWQPGASWCLWVFVVSFCITGFFCALAMQTTYQLAEGPQDVFDLILQKGLIKLDNPVFTYQIEKLRIDDNLSLGCDIT